VFVRAAADVSADVDEAAEHEKWLPQLPV
jgi:hypothetical protein